MSKVGILRDGVLSGENPSVEDYYTNRPDFTRLSTSTFSVTDNAENQAAFKAGTAIAYRTTAGSGAFLYGIIKSYSSGTVTIMGVSLPDPLGELQTVPNNKVITAIIQIAGELTVADDQIKVIMKTGFYWEQGEAYLVALRGWVETAAAGADLNIMLARNTVSTDILNSVLNLAQATTVVDSGITINSSNYRVSFNEKFFLNVDQIGSSTPGSDLTVNVIGVMP